MTCFRRHLGALTSIWLLFQVASLTALLPGICCAAHAEDAQSTAEDCHRTSSPADHCPMASADGQPCPEHAGTDAHDRCVMTGTCDGPMAALASLFSAPAILTDETVVRVDVVSSMLAIDRSVSPLLALSFDTPPPRL